MDDPEDEFPHLPNRDRNFAHVYINMDEMHEYIFYNPDLDLYYDPNVPTYFSNTLIWHGSRNCYHYFDEDNNDLADANSREFAADNRFAYTRIRRLPFFILHRHEPLPVAALPNPAFPYTMMFPCPECVLNNHHVYEVFGEFRRQPGQSINGVVSAVMMVVFFNNIFGQRHKESDN